MNKAAMTFASPKEKGPSVYRQGIAFFQTEPGQLLALGAVVALLNFITQIFFRRELAPGEFGVLNTALGLVALLTVPLWALQQAFMQYLALDHAPERREHVAAIRLACLPVLETFALIWGSASLLLVLVILPMLGVTRFLLHVFTLLSVFVALGTVASGALLQSQNRLRFWGWLLTAAALEQLIVGAWLGWKLPWAESGLAAFLLAGLITLKPSLTQPERPESESLAQSKAWRAMLDREFLLRLGATFSVVLALFFFSSGDRLVALRWFGIPSDNNFGFVDWTVIDAYQTAGLLGRALIWGTQPLLLLFYLQRSRLQRTTPASLKFFWIYLGTLLVGAFLLSVFSRPLSWIFCGSDYQQTATLVSSFAVVMIPLGLLQALGTFALASRRFVECFLLGGCGLAYFIGLGALGRIPQIMLTSMFLGGVFSIIIVLFVGIVRWGRKHP